MAWSQEAQLLEKHIFQLLLWISNNIPLSVQANCDKCLTEERISFKHKGECKGGSTVAPQPPSLPPGSQIVSYGRVTEGKLPWGPLVGLNLLAYTDCGLYWIIIAGWMIHDYLSRIMDTLELKINHLVNILILFWGCQFWYFKFSLYYTNCWCQFRYFFPYLLFLGGYQLKEIPCIININIISYYGTSEGEN